MNLRCIYCQTPFTIGRAEMLGAIINMNEKNQNHYDAHCPRCRRANSISRQRMELFFPNWREAAKKQAAAPPPMPAAALKTQPIPKPRKDAVGKAPSVKKPAAAASPSRKSTTASKKPVVKKTTPAKKAVPKTKKK